jgi:hypothetical protein
LVERHLNSRVEDLSESISILAPLVARADVGWATWIANAGAALRGPISFEFPQARNAHFPDEDMVISAHRNENGTHRREIRWGPEGKFHFGISSTPRGAYRLAQIGVPNKAAFASLHPDHGLMLHRTIFLRDFVRELIDEDLQTPGVRGVYFHVPNQQHAQRGLIRSTGLDLLGMTVNGSRICTQYGTMRAPVAG